MRLTKEVLENGIVIDAEGELRGFKSFKDVKRGELYLKISPEGTTNNFVKSSGSISKTRRQATQEAFCVLFYFTAMADALLKE